MSTPSWLPEHQAIARKLLDAYGLESTVSLVKTVNGRKKRGRKSKPDAEKFFESVDFFDEVMEEGDRLFPGCGLRFNIREGRLVVPTTEQIKTAIVAVAERRKPTLVPETAERYFRLGRAARMALYRYFDPIAE